ncbi:hypothetical protein CEXT_271011 [Caerostris extrusa]|uniref:Uncharacterized protein n=1 Tax=Caerostris extrusa TaxID=172846 RepID=A0AAV4P9G4_CAEEX|nr:hypothetical protein CEXT_271011 [Caerostris extrusa]
MSNLWFKQMNEATGHQESFKKSSKMGSKGPDAHSCELPWGVQWDDFTSIFDETHSSKLWNWFKSEKIATTGVQDLYK